jgi:hypothetical protein
MTNWIKDRLPTANDADLHGLVRWNPMLPGMLMRWDDVRPGEAWRHTSAWDGPLEPQPSRPVVPMGRGATW